MAYIKSISLVLISSLALVACELDEDPSFDEDLRAKPVKSGSDARNVHLAPVLRFSKIPAGGDKNRGRRLFGLAEDEENEDVSEALFEGFSRAAGRTIVSNGRTCFSCHRGQRNGLGIPPGPLLDPNNPEHVPITDTLFTEIDADAQGHPDALKNLDQFGLILYRPHRFDPRKNPKDGTREAIAWRKSIRLINTGMMSAFLHDGRTATMAKTDLGAVLSHTQDRDDRFDDLFSEKDADDLAAFVFSQFKPKEVEALRDPKHPLYDELVSDPYYTVPVETEAEQRGRDLFHQYCFGCHNMPNVFTSLENVESQANGRPPSAPSWAPSTAIMYNIGVSEHNKHKLRFSSLNQKTGKLEPVVIRLANENGSIVHHKITFDIGHALITARAKDIGRFKVPQLRGLKDNAPYFHDNSADTLEEVVDYFTSDYYNDSPDGQRFPIHLSDQEKADLIAFLAIL